MRASTTCWPRTENPRQQRGDRPQICRVSDNRKRAALLLHNAEQQFAEQGPFWRNAALAYQRLGQAEDAQRALARYAALEPSVAEKAKLEASLLTNEGKFREADQVLAAALPTLAEAGT